VYDRKLAVVGFVLILAPLYFVSASLLEFGLRVGFLFDSLETFLSVAGWRAVFNAVSPFVFLSGLCLALALNTYAVVRLDVRREAGTLVSTVGLKLNVSNRPVAAVSVLLWSRSWDTPFSKTSPTARERSPQASPRPGPPIRLRGKTTS
jgi:hypothetical protein